MEPIDASLASELLKKPEPKPVPKKKGGRKKKDNLEDLTVNGWFKLIHVALVQCSFCPRNRSCYRLEDGRMICRYCFLEGKHLNVSI